MGKIKIISTDIGENKTTDKTWDYLQKIIVADISENSDNIIVTTSDCTIEDNIIQINKQRIYANTPDFITYWVKLKFGGGLDILLNKYKKNIGFYEFRTFSSNGFKIKFEADSGYTDNLLNNPNFNPEFTKKQYLNGQELGLFYQALMKELFAIPNKGYLLFEPNHREGGGNLYFDTEYYNELKESIDEKFYQGKFAESNAEYDWLQLKNSIDNSENIIDPNINDYRIYLVSK